MSDELELPVLYADTSALVRAYFADEPDHDELRSRLIDGVEPVVSSELTLVEFTSAVAAAVRAGRLPAPDVVLDRFDADCGDDGPLTLLRLDTESVLPVARQLVRTHRVRTLDALHLAVALTDATALAGDAVVVLVSRDADQVEAARASGLAVE